MLGLNDEEVGVGHAKPLGEGCELHRSACSTAVAVIEQRTRGGIVDDAVIGIMRCCTDMKCRCSKSTGTAQTRKDGIVGLDCILRYIEILNCINVANT